MLVDADVSEKHCLHLTGLKLQGKEIEGLYRSRRARADGREPIRGKEDSIGIWSNREPTFRFQGGAWVGSGLREGNGPFEGSPKCVVFLFGAGFLFPYVANERLP
jgi:hypothetical protein